MKIVSNSISDKLRQRFIATHAVSTDSKCRLRLHSIKYLELQAAGPSAERKRVMVRNTRSKASVRTVEIHFTLIRGKG